MVQWLLVLFVLALAAPVLQSVTARAVTTGATLVELCTVDGIKQMVLDRAGHPIDRELPGQHAAHDCAGCLTACGKHGTPVGLPPSQLPDAGFCAGSPPSVAVSVALRRPSAYTLLLPRGPPIPA